MSMPSVKILTDSITRRGHRLTTFEVRFHLFILAEIDTHRVFSRSFRSSRAVPVLTLVEETENDPALPVSWGANRRGMVADAEVQQALDAVEVWTGARADACRHARTLAELGLHKQLANRLIQPFAWGRGIITATEWENFYALRTAPDAQPEFQALAKAMLEAHLASTPRVLEAGQWHAPYLTEEERRWLDEARPIGRWEGEGPARVWTPPALLMHAAARCARVSYGHLDGAPIDPEKDRATAERLLAAGHVAPFEHIAMPAPPEATGFMGNFYGWAQMRKFLPNETRTFAPYREALDRVRAQLGVGDGTDE